MMMNDVMIPMEMELQESMQLMVKNLDLIYLLSFHFSNDYVKLLVVFLFALLLIFLTFIFYNKKS
jgi:hypothetical protein